MAFADKTYEEKVLDLQARLKRAQRTGSDERVSRVRRIAADWGIDDLEMETVDE